MKIKILEKKPQKVKAKILDTGNIVEFAPKFFNKRFKMGFFEIVNPHQIQERI